MQQRYPQSADASVCAGRKAAVRALSPSFPGGGGRYPAAPWKPGGQSQTRTQEAPYISLACLPRKQRLAGLAAARARGRNGGRPYKMTPAKLRLQDDARKTPSRSGFHGPARDKSQRPLRRTGHHTANSVPARIADGRTATGRPKAAVPVEKYPVRPCFACSGQAWSPWILWRGRPGTSHQDQFDSR